MTDDSSSINGESVKVGMGFMPVQDLCGSRDDVTTDGAMTLFSNPMLTSKDGGMLLTGSNSGAYGPAMMQSFDRSLLTSPPKGEKRNHSHNNVIELDEDTHRERTAVFNLSVSDRSRDHRSGTLQVAEGPMHQNIV